jgi:hypothetical protein
MLPDNSHTAERESPRILPLCPLRLPIRPDQAFLINSASKGDVLRVKRLDFAHQTVLGSRRGCRSSSLQRPGGREALGWFGCRRTDAISLGIPSSALITRVASSWVSTTGRCAVCRGRAKSSSHGSVVLATQNAMDWIIEHLETRGSGATRPHSGSSRTESLLLSRRLQPVRVLRR